MFNLFDLEEYLPGHDFSPIYGIGDGTNQDSAKYDHDDILDCADALGMVPV